MAKRLSLRGLVLGWVILTTTFVWTPTMRLLFKPEIHHWNLFGIVGSGRGGLFWLLPLAVLCMLLLFYFEGRGKPARPFFYVLLMLWQLPVTVLMWLSVATHGSGATFTGAAWGVTIPLLALAIPFTIFTALSVILIWRELRTGVVVASQSWTALKWRELAFVAALMAPVFVLFRVGEGFNLWVKLAIVLNVIQWIILTDAVGPADKPRVETTRQT